jgi:O-antigen/teichoic acid export membrane protein
VNDSAPALRALLGQGSIYTLGVMLQLASGVLVVMVVTRLVSPEQYGILATAMVVHALAAIIATGGLPSALMRSYFVGNAGLDSARSLVGVTIVLAFVVVGVIAFTGPLWSQIFSNLDYGADLKIAVWTALPTAAVAAVQQFLRAEERPRAFVSTVAFTSIGAQGLGVAGAAVTGEATGYLVGFGLGNAIAALVGLLLIRAGGMQVPQRGLVVGAFAIGLPIVPHTLTAYVMSAGDRVVIERLEGFASVGRYQIAYVIGSLGFMLVSAVNQAWAPIIYKAEEAVRWRILSDTSVTLLAMATLIGGALALSAAPILTIFAPPDYRLEELAPVSIIVAASIVPFTVYTAYVHPLVWLARTRIMAVITPVAAALNIGLNILLIPVLGLEGAAVATLASYAFLSAAIGIVSRRIAPVPWRTRSLVWATLGMAALVVTAAAQPTDGGWSLVRALESAGLIGLAIGVGVRGSRPRDQRGDATTVG